WLSCCLKRAGVVETNQHPPLKPGRDRSDSHPAGAGPREPIGRSEMEERLRIGAKYRLDPDIDYCGGHARPSARLAHPTNRTAPRMRKLLLPGLLSFNGGFVDTAGFLGLQGLFTAHVTGNFVTLGAALVFGTHGVIAKVLALPEFVLVVALARLLGSA